MALLDGVAWESKVFKGGEWTDGRGGTYAVTEPATGNELGRMGRADAEDVAEAAASAAQAQKVWAALPHTARAAVLRRAGDLWAENATRSATGTCARPAPSRRWPTSPCTSRPRSAARPRPCLGQPIGQVRPSEQRRQSMARQRPSGVVAVDLAFDVRMILGIRSGGAGARARQRRSPEARPAHGRHRRHGDGAHLRGGRGCRPASCRCSWRQGRRRGDGDRPVRPRDLVYRSTAVGWLIGELAGRH